MSAFTCGKKTFETIISALWTFRDRIGHAVPFLNDKSEEDGRRLAWVKRIGNELVRMNIESVNYLYTPRHEAEPIVQYDDFDVVEFDKNDKEKYKEQLVAACRCIHCWQYQSCELPDFEEYWQSQMVNTLDNVCCMELLKACNRETYDNYIVNSSETRKLPCYRDSEIWGD